MDNNDLSSKKNKKPENIEDILEKYISRGDKNLQKKKEQSKKKKDNKEKE